MKNSQFLVFLIGFLTLKKISYSSATEWDYQCSTLGEKHIYKEQCFRYFECTEDNSGNWVIALRTCPLGRIYDDELSRCVDGLCPTSSPPIDCTPAPGTSTSIPTRESESTEPPIDTTIIPTFPTTVSVKPRVKISLDLESDAVSPWSWVRKPKYALELMDLYDPNLCPITQESPSSGNGGYWSTCTAGPPAQLIFYTNQTNQPIETLNSLLVTAFFDPEYSKLQIFLDGQFFGEIKNTGGWNTIGYDLITIPLYHDSYFQFFQERTAGNGIVANDIIDKITFIYE